MLIPKYTDLLIPKDNKVSNTVHCQYIINMIAFQYDNS